MPQTKRPLTVAEYFAGIGLVRMGLDPLDWKVLFANDFSPKKFAMYQGFFPDAANHYELADIFKLDPSAIPHTTLATCSFPCIDLSLAGNMNGMVKGPHSSAFWGFVKILGAQAKDAPPLVLVENVPGWLHSNGGQDFRVTVQALNDLGYSCDVFALDALRFTPQSRLRIFLVGARHESASDASPRILQRSKALLPDRLRRSVQSNLDLRWFYIDLPEPPPLLTSGLAAIVEKLPKDDDRWWSAPEVRRHLAMMAPLHRQRLERLKARSKYAYRTFFRRRRQGLQRAEVRPDDLAGCLRTASGGSGKQFLIQVGKSTINMRAMTPREYARLQGVPDSCRIATNGVQALTGFGDAVCVPAITWIAQNALMPLVTSLQLTPEPTDLHERQSNPA